MSETFIGKTFPAALKRALANKLCLRLRELQPNEIITYEEMGNIIEMDVPKDPKAYNVLCMARAILETEEKIRFATINRHGIQRMTSASMVDASSAYKDRIRNMVNTGMNRLNCARYDELDTQRKIKFNQDMSLMGVLRMVASPKVEEKIQEKCKTKKLDYAETLKLLNVNI